MREAQKPAEKKEIAYERVLFFSDAIVAIAVTLLALNLRLEVPNNQHLTFAGLLQPWRQYLAFVLSFIIVAAYWRAHHDFFIYIKKMDGRLMAFNTCWLFCMVVLPFSASVVSSHFGDSPAMCLYSGNILCASLFQNFIWDYADTRPGFIDHEQAGDNFRRRIRLLTNLDIINGAVALALSFFFPRTAFFLLFFRLPTFVFGALYTGVRRRQLVKKS